MNLFSLFYKPKYNIYSMSRAAMQNKLKEIPVQIPCGLFDSNYYYTDDQGWANILINAISSSLLYKSDKFDCENYAMKAMSTIAEKYGLNAFGVCLGHMSQGYHGFNIFYVGNRFMLFEPNLGYSYAGYFEIGDHSYQPSQVLM